MCCYCSRKVRHVRKSCAVVKNTARVTTARQPSYMCAVLCQSMNCSLFCGVRSTASCSWMSMQTATCMWVVRDTLAHGGSDRDDSHVMTHTPTTSCVGCFRWFGYGWQAEAQSSSCEYVHMYKAFGSLWCCCLFDSMSARRGLAN